MLADEPAALIDEIAELAAAGVEHLVLEFLVSDATELDKQMELFVERVRPQLA